MGADRGHTRPVAFLDTWANQTHGTARPGSTMRQHAGLRARQRTAAWLTIHPIRRGPSRQCLRSDGAASAWARARWPAGPAACRHAGDHAPPRAVIAPTSVSGRSAHGLPLPSPAIPVILCVLYGTLRTTNRPRGARLRVHPPRPSPSVPRRAGLHSFKSRCPPDECRRPRAACGESARPHARPCTRGRLCCLFAFPCPHPSPPILFGRPSSQRQAPAAPL